MYEIEKNIPISGKRRKPTKYPWRDLAVGESFFVPGGTSPKMSSAKRGMERRTEYRFTIRTIEGGVRVWRTS